METKEGRGEQGGSRFDKITGQSIEQRANLLKVRVDHGPGPFFQIFVATKDDAQEAVHQIWKILGVPETNIIELSFPPDAMDVNDLLADLKERIQHMTGDKAGILVSGIEKRGSVVAGLNAGKEGASLVSDRVVHDYSQEIFDSNSGKKLRAEYQETGKKIVILTCIGNTEGEEIYEAMLRSALQTRFSNGVLEV